MKLEQKVCSLEWSQKLVDAGIVVESIFCHYKCEDGVSITLSQFSSDKQRIIAPAPIFPELAELLPDDIVFFRDVDGWNVEGTDIPLADYQIITENTEANVAAAMLIWLNDQ